MPRRRPRVEGLAVCTVEHLCSVNYRSMSTFYQVMELEKQMGTERDAALFRAMCAAYEQFESELVAIFEAEQCEE